MTDQKNPQTENVDWAERLKASMNQTPAERPVSTAPAAEEDDLAALLRAQLAHRAESSETLGYDLDTSEFEEDDDPEDFEESEYVDEPAESEGSADSEAFENFEDYAEPEDLEESETLDDPCEFEDPEESETLDDTREPEEPEESETLDDTCESEDPEESETLDDPCESEDSEESAVSAEQSKETDESEESEGAREPESDRNAPSANVPHTVPDTEEEGFPSPDGDVGDIRLKAADEESTRILEEEGFLVEPEVLPDPEEPAKETAEAASPTDETPSAAAVRPAPAVSADPLQLGLDDIVPRVDTLPPMEVSDEIPVINTKNYAAHMTHDPREEAVRDTELYLRLGYEEELTRSEQQEAIEEARRRAHERQAEALRNETVPIRSRREYADRKQAPAIERAYDRARRLCVTRLCVAAVGALFGILYDYLGVLLQSVSAVTFADHFLYPLVGTLWTVLVCLPFLSRLGRGFRSLVDFEPTRYAVSALALAVAVTHGILAILVHRPFLYGGVALFMLTVAAVSEYTTTVAEHRAFNVVSSGKAAYVLTDEATPASSVGDEAAKGERVLTAVRTGRVSDYFARTGRYNPYMGRLNYLLPVALLAAIVCAGMSILQGGTLLYNALPVFTSTYLACLPAAYLVAMSLPLCRANGILRKKGAAVIGSAAPVAYAIRKKTRLLLRDGDAFKGAFCKEITLRDDPNARLWKRRARVLFRLIGCPLWNESPLEDEKIDGYAVEVSESEEGFVRLQLIDLAGGDTSEVMMGSREALTSRGIRLPKVSMESEFKRRPECDIVYIAFDRRFRIAYSVKYRLRRPFTHMAEKLASMGDSAGVVTYDPLVHEELMRQDQLPKNTSIRLVRPAYVESVKEARSGGVVATGSGTDLLYPYAACRRVRGVYRTAHAVGWLVILAAMGLSLLSVFFTPDMVLSAVTVTAWQMLLTLITAASSLIAVNRKSLFLSADGKKPDKEKSSAPIQHTTTKTDKETSST